MNSLLAKRERALFAVALFLLWGFGSTCRYKSNHEEALLTGAAFLLTKGYLDPNVAPVALVGGNPPSFAATFQIQLQNSADGSLHTSYDVGYYDLDLFDTPNLVRSDLHDRSIGLVCYFSAGSAEDWRADYHRFLPTDLGKGLDGWAGEKWLDIRSINVFDIMLARLDVAVERGCAGVDMDNVDGYSNDTGFPLTATDQLAFNRNLANEAHKRGLFVMLKNSGGQASKLLDYFDGVVNEQCHAYDECSLYAPFIATSKPVWNLEYEDTYRTDPTDLCQTAVAERLHTLVLPLLLNDDFRISCDP